MKKILVIWIALIGFGFITIAWNGAKDCYCPRCEVKLQSYQKSEEKWVDCYRCGGEGLVNCTKQEWQDCRPCRGTGCKDGYTKDNGKYCAYGKCGSCDGNGGKYVNVMKKECKCTSCEYNSRSGRYGQYKIGRYYTVLQCPSCNREYNGCD